MPCGDSLRDREVEEKKGRENDREEFGNGHAKTQRRLRPRRCGLSVDGGK